MTTLNALDPESFKLLYLWIHQANGASSTLAELMVLARFSPHLVKKALRALAAEQLCHYSGLADHAACELTLNAHNLFPPLYQTPAMSPSPATQPHATPEPSHASQLPAEITQNNPQTPQNFLQKNFFSPEEEDLIKLIKLNNLNSSSSESQNDEKIFQPPADYQQRLEILDKDCVFWVPRIREDLALLPWATPDYLRRHACQFYHTEQRETKEAGMLRVRIKAQATAPDYCWTCHAKHNPNLDDAPLEDAPLEDAPFEDDTLEAISPPAPPEIIGYTGPTDTVKFPPHAWHATLEQLKADMPKNTYNAWVKDLTLTRWAHGHYTIQCPNADTCAWITERLTSTLRRILTSITAQEVALEFIA